MTQESDSLRFAVLFAYNGMNYNGLERSKGPQTIESVVLSALATVASKHIKDTPHISLLNISRSSATEKGEHASRQVLSLEMTGSPELKLPMASEVNALLPEDIHVFEILRIPAGFSARRSCDARTFEYLIPTFVFAPPPKDTHYAYNELGDTDSDSDFMYPSGTAIEQPQGGLFKTLKRTFSTGKRAKQQSDQTLQESSTTNAAPAPVKQKKKGFGYFWSKLMFGKEIPQKLRKQEEHEAVATASSTMVRKKSLRRSQAPPIALEKPQVSELSSSFNPPTQEDDGAFLGMTGLMTTLKRTLSRRKDARKEFNEPLEKKQEEEQLLYFDVLDIPWDNDYLNGLKNYRMTEKQWKSLEHIISIYNGTHNWHNYIPGASYDDPRCYLRILNIELAKPEEHQGIEWVRIKVQAKAFAKLQVRKMMAFAIMVIRTNTPRNVIANSFGFAKIFLPEAPSVGVILDEPHYEDFNAYAQKLNCSSIDFDAFKDSIQEFRQQQIHQKVYEKESKEMQFAQWIRNLDSFSFMYTYFLNERGVIETQRNAIKEKREE